MQRWSGVPHATPTTESLVKKGSRWLVMAIANVGAAPSIGPSERRARGEQNGTTACSIEGLDRARPVSG